ncbi:MAG: YihY/virulence factor BrkB family protein [Pseudomonadota bacterium]
MCRPWALIKQTVAAWRADFAPSMGAALSYYTVFSLAPTLLIVIAVAGMVFGEDAARGAVFGQLTGLMGPDAAKAVEGLLADVGKPNQGALATAIGVALLLIGATTVFAELQDALDRIWRAPERKDAGGVWGLLRARFLSFGMVLGIAFLLMVSMVLSASVSALGKWWSPLFGGWEVLAQGLIFAFDLTVSTFGFAMIYKLMPRVKVQWRDVWIGAAVTALLFALGKLVIGLYIGKSGIASAFGAAGSLVIILLWVYYSAQIFLLGAEFTWVSAGARGSRRETSAAGPSDIAPPKTPVRLSEPPRRVTC